MEAKFISNVDPDDAAAVLNAIDLAHSLFILVSKSGTTLETLTNEMFVKEALKKAGRLETFISVPNGQHGPVTFNEDSFKQMTDFFLKEAAKQ